MVHPLQHIVDLAEILFQKGVTSTVLSPGSRNAPLINAFYNRFGTKCISVVDERSAAYLGLGLARQSNRPVVLVCTSGTAVLNYAPALAEAYYQGIPLIAVTADRPLEWIDQQDNQTIRQVDVYKNYIKGGFQLNEVFRNESEICACHAVVQKAYHLATRPTQGPVHINIPLREPLYMTLPKPSVIEIDELANSTDTSSELELLLKAWKSAEHIMLIHGQDRGNDNLVEVLNVISADKRVVCIAENIANVANETIISSPELLLGTNRCEMPPPGLLIYSGGQIVSKRLKKYLRKLPSVETWRVGIDNFPMDTFKHNNKQLNRLSAEVYSFLAKAVEQGEESYFRQCWHRGHHVAIQECEHYVNEVPLCDTSAMQIIMKYVPRNSILELGNSSVIRLSQLFRARADVLYRSNRGVSGIDGCVSAAVGTAMATSKLTVLVIGDLSFLYDSNGLWNKKLPDNFRIIVLNNRGGGIFGLIPGPSNSDSFDEFFLAHHPVDLKKLVEAYNLPYFCANSNTELEAILPGFYEGSDSAKVLVINTSFNENIAGYRGLFNSK